ncbi:MAG TPA: quinolinate synthase NadA [Methanomassiliicoccaceae archaeon]|nr:quinolinate synthase NadA [Methanomassiliicoccaceae archaeon]
MQPQERIAELKKERNAVILAHNYQQPEIQEIADFVGDSLGLAVQASKADADIIVFCGVDFMAESAKILNPDKIVLHPETKACCPMAAMCEPSGVRMLKKDFPRASVVAYVNTSAECKAEADICCTSSNAVKVVNSLDSDLIIFIPDENLANYVQRFTDKDIIPWPDYCPTHESISLKKIEKLKEEHPKAVVLVHPECRPEVIDAADAARSTEGMLNYIRESDKDEFIIGTEQDMIYRLSKEFPDKRFIEVPGAVCPTMKLITLDNVLAALESLSPEVNLPPELMEKAQAPLERMIALGRGD